jgi:RES domain-containing protein
MGETTWYRIVGRKRTARDDALPARSGRFHDDPRGEPTSYLGDSLLTVWKEAQVARAGAARLNPEAFRGWRLTLKDAALVDLRRGDGRKRWSVSEAEVLSDPAPTKCKEVARAIRRSKDVFHGILYRSVRHPPNGVVDSRAP